MGFDRLELAQRARSEHGRADFVSSAAAAMLPPQPPFAIGGGADECYKACLLAL